MYENELILTMETKIGNNSHMDRSIGRCRPIDFFVDLPMKPVFFFSGLGNNYITAIDSDHFTLETHVRQQHNNTTFIFPQVLFTLPH